MAVREIRGQVLLNPTGARTGGTLIEGITDDPQNALVPLLIPVPVIRTRVGVGVYSRVEVRRGRRMPITAVLTFLNLKNLEQARTMMLGHLTSDGKLIEDDANATEPFTAMPTFSLIVRPHLETEPHFYAPAMQLATTMDFQLAYGTVPHLMDQSLPLISAAPTTDVMPYLIGNATQIDTEYFPPPEVP